MKNLFPHERENNLSLTHPTAFFISLGLPIFLSTMHSPEGRKKKADEKKGQKISKRHKDGQRRKEKPPLLPLSHTDTC